MTRLYAYELNDQGFPVPYAGEWLAIDDLRDAALALDYVPGAVDTWLDPTLVRGKGLTQAQARVDQYAY